MRFPAVFYLGTLKPNSCFNSEFTAVAIPCIFPDSASAVLTVLIKI